jgi:hypothetical protein
MSIDNRKYPRQEIALIVRIEASDGSRVSCWLSDLSQSGARLAVGHARKLPEEFLLVLSAEMQRWCRVVWRSDQEVGVHFVPRSQSADRLSEKLAASKDALRRFVMIKCPKTRRNISTGIRACNTDELAKLSRVRRFAQCPHCKAVHGWSVTEATI